MKLKMTLPFEVDVEFFVAEMEDHLEVDVLHVWLTTDQGPVNVLKGLSESELCLLEDEILELLPEKGD